MSTLRELAPGWERRLGELVGALDVPGAVLGVSHRGERFVAAAGVAGLRNPAPVTAATAFQLGSISKLYTATLLMSIAGPEILERPAAELAPEAAWIEPEIQVVHLLTHSSGLGGDTFADTGRGDDALARYVARLQQLPRDTPPPPGHHYSYCNSGYGVLGRIVESLTDQTYDAALRERLLDEALEAGALGLSSGLIYPPGAFSPADELIGLARRLGDGRVYATHMRDEGAGLLSSVQETIELGERAGCRVQVSHLKAVGRASWGLVGCALERLDAARARGVVLGQDAYPYEATSTMLTAVLPAWLGDGGPDALLRRLSDDAALARAREEHRAGDRLGRDHGREHG